MPLEDRTARLTVLIDPRKKALLERICAEQDTTPSQVVRQSDPAVHRRPDGNAVDSRRVGRVRAAPEEALMTRQSDRLPQRKRMTRLNVASSQQDGWGSDEPEQ